MIFLRFKIFNPWFKDNDNKSVHYFSKHKQLSKNKNLEIQVSKFQPDDLLGFVIDLRWKGQDHQGPEFEISVFGYMFMMKIYDSRHWNYTEGRWYG
jgi:hypothetical protein